MRTYTRINEDYLDDITIDTEDISMHDEICSDIDHCIHDGAQPPLDLSTLPDAFYPVSDKDDLSKIIELCISLYGKECNLNWIDVSGITDMSRLFYYSEFNGDISRWDVSHVTNMSLMFGHSQFNGNISDWDVSNVENMGSMFASSCFNSNISGWNVSRVRQMQMMFYACPFFNSEISSWNTSSVTNMNYMFSDAVNFNQNLSKWDVSSVTHMISMFRNSSIDCDLSGWDVSNVKWHSGIFVGCPLNQRPDRQPKFEA